MSRKQWLLLIIVCVAIGIALYQFRAHPFIAPWFTGINGLITFFTTGVQNLTTTLAQNPVGTAIGAVGGAGSIGTLANMLHEKYKENQAVLETAKLQEKDGIIYAQEKQITELTDKLSSKPVDTEATKKLQEAETKITGLEKQVQTLIAEKNEAERIGIAFIEAAKDKKQAPKVH